MNSVDPQSDSKTRSKNSWAGPVAQFDVAEMPAGSLNLNVQGRQLSGLVHGFGQMWQKTYKIRLDGATVSPVSVIQTWKQEFESFWPKGNHFYNTSSGPNSGITPGDVAVLNLAAPGGVNAPGGLPLVSTGIMVIYADDESFAFMTPQGHMFAGMITFSSFEDRGTVLQIQALIRASDPFIEVMFRLGLTKGEDDFWKQTLRNLAARFGSGSQPEMKVVCIDPHLQWKEAGNIWQDAIIRTGLYIMASPFRWIGKKIKR
jgi:hypothetical protein